MNMFANLHHVNSLLTQRSTPVYLIPTNKETLKTFPKESERRVIMKLVAKYKFNLSSAYHTMSHSRSHPTSSGGSLYLNTFTFYASPLALALRAKQAERK